MQEIFQKRQTEIKEKWLKLLGGIPDKRPVPDAKIILEEQGDGYRKIKVSLAADTDHADDRIYAWLLLPDHVTAPLPVILALHPTTGGCGKDIVIGEPERLLPLSAWTKMSSQMIRNRAYGVDLVKAGFAVFAPDIYGVGERIEPGHRCHDISTFTKRHPTWSAVGKTIYDNMIAIDWLSTLPEIDAKRIGVVGHSLGGHSSIFLAGLDERVTATCSNGGVTRFNKELEHWARVPMPEELKDSYPPVYTYIPNFLPYMAHSEIPNPLEFGDVMSLIAPRPLLYAGSINSAGTPGLVEVHQKTWDAAYEMYILANAEEAIEYSIYPGDHDFPPRARKVTVDWFKRVLNH